LRAASATAPPTTRSTASTIATAAVAGRVI
jgi:hypothetical protein